MMCSSKMQAARMKTNRRPHFWDLKASMVVGLELLAMMMQVACGAAAAADESIMIAPSTTMLQKLDAAITALEKAQDVPNVRLKACDVGLAAAVAAANEAQLFMSPDELLHVARQKVALARDSNLKCLNVLRRTHIFSRASRMALYKLALQADEELEEVEAYLPMIANNHSAAHWSAVGDFNQALLKHVRESPHYHEQIEYALPNPTCSSKVVDGTTCQYAACAKGRGLVSCSTGFAKGVVGGYYGIDYIVTRDDDVPDNPPVGSLRYGVNLAKENSGGVWITFDKNMLIELRGMLWVHSHTTIDGRGYNITLQKHCLVVCNAQQVILENFGINTVRGGDTVHIFSDSSKIWVDHVTSFGGDLGLVSVVQGSTDVTISNCKLQNYNFNMLLGASDHDEQDKNMRVTVFRNHFLDSMQRMPHCRWGWCHVANNLYTNWGYYAVGARVNARVRTENNVFIPSRVTEVTPWHPGAAAGGFDMSARIESKGDLLLDGATFHQFLLATHDVKPPYPSDEYPPIIAPEKIHHFVQACAGQQTHKTVDACLRSSNKSKRKSST